MSSHTLSSTAKRTYWLGRYLERTESTARLIAENGNLMMDLPARLPHSWSPLISITGSEATFATFYDEPTERNVTRFMIGDLRNPGSILSSLGSARENVRTLRGIIPRQAVEYIIELHLYARDNLSGSLSRSRRAEGLSVVPALIQQIDGFMSANMLHDAHWNFWRLGNFVERADMTTRIIDVGTDNPLQTADAPGPFADLQWRSVLRSLNATQSYLAVRQEPIHQTAVVGFLIGNASLPRSLTYSLESLRNGLRTLPRSERVLTAVNRLRRFLQSSEIEDLEGADLHEFLDGCQAQLAEIHQQINRTYFEFRPSRKTSPARRSPGKQLSGTHAK